MGYFWMEGDTLAPPRLTSTEVIIDILKLANPSKDDYLVDLGCGDGRIPILASVIYGCKSAGIEIEDLLV